MSVNQRILLTCLLVFAVGQTFFLLHIGSIKDPVFDEKHYLPAARQWLAWQDTTNLEHPPLGKQIIAVGMTLWGDRPLGWRFMSTLFGALTLVGMYLWARAIFRTESGAIVVVLLTLGNQLLYVQSRTGTLDGFMFCFEVFGLAAVSRAWDPTLPPPRTRRLLQLAGIAFGLSTACKWSGVIGWAISAAAVAGTRIAARAGITARGEGKDPWYDPRLFAQLTADDYVSAFVIFPIGSYFVTFLPYLFVDREPHYSLLDLLRMQRQIWELQQRVVDPGTRYASSWTTWPLMLRPIWYAFRWEPDRSGVRGAFYLGNPLLMWGGLVALGTCVWAWLRRGSRAAFWIVLTWTSFYLAYAVIPRKVSYYHYYYPAAMTLGLAVAFVLERWDSPVRWHGIDIRWRSVLLIGATFAIFAYFFDLMSGTKIGSETFRSRMWLRSWY